MPTRCYRKDGHSLSGWKTVDPQRSRVRGGPHYLLAEPGLAAHIFIDGHAVHRHGGTAAWHPRFGSSVRSPGGQSVWPAAAAVPLYGGIVSCWVICQHNSGKALQTVLAEALVAARPVHAAIPDVIGSVVISLFVRLAAGTGRCKDRSRVDSALAIGQRSPPTSADLHVSRGGRGRRET